MEIRYEARAVKDMRALAPSDRERIRLKITQYAADPVSLSNNVKALRGSDLFRLRVGDHRVIFAMDETGAITIMIVHRVRHRREAYE